MSSLTESQPISIARGARRSSFLQAGLVKTRFTREGFHILFILAFVFIGAVLRDVNLLVLLAGMMVGMLLVQWRVCKRSLLHLQLNRSLPDIVHAGQDFDVVMQIRNPRHWLPARLVMIEESIYRTEPHPQKQPTGITLVVPHVPTVSTSSISYHCQLDKRGIYHFGPATLATQYPIGLMRASAHVSNRQTLIVHPRLGTLTSRWQQLVRIDRQGLSKSASRAGVNEGDFYGLRAWQQGDSRRWIHWRTSARLGELAVRQFEQQQRLNIVLLLDLWRVNNQDSGSFQSAAETAISFVATLANALTRQGNHRLAVVIAGQKLSQVHKIQSRAMLTGLLDSLSVAAPATKPDLQGAMEGLFPVLMECQSFIVVSTRESLLHELQNGKGADTRNRVLQNAGMRWINTARGELDTYFEMEQG